MSTITRTVCGTTPGIRAHTDRDEPMCTICADHTATLALAAERRRPVPQDPPDPWRELLRILDHLLRDADRRTR